jgi:hypothetical protein
MSKPGPVVARAFALLRNELYQHLEEAECLAEYDREWSEDDEDAARKVINDLATVIRGMVADHRERESGACASCGYVCPCPTVVTIYGLVTDPERQFAALVRRAHA